MKTLKEIKEYLKSLEKEEITSKRGNKYEFVEVDSKTIYKLLDFKSVILGIHSVNNITFYLFTWYENDKKIEIIMKREEA